MQRTQSAIGSSNALWKTRKSGSLHAEQKSLFVEHRNITTARLRELSRDRSQHSQGEVCYSREAFKIMLVIENTHKLQVLGRLVPALRACVRGGEWYVGAPATEPMLSAWSGGSLWGRPAWTVSLISGFSVLFFSIQSFQRRKAFQGNTECLKEK